MASKTQILFKLDPKTVLFPLRCYFKDPLEWFRRVGRIFHRFSIQVEKSWYDSSFVYLRHKALQSQNFSPFQPFMGSRAHQLEHSKGTTQPQHLHMTMLKMPLKHVTESCCWVKKAAAESFWAAAAFLKLSLSWATRISALCPRCQLGCSCSKKIHGHIILL